MQKNDELTQATREGAGEAIMTLAESNTALQPAPDFVTGGDTGTEHITKDDIQMPRLAIAQKMSPQLEEDKADQYIPGLKIGEMFNSLTGTIYGKGPLQFVIVRADPPRWIEFYPREAGGGVKDMDVRAGDPRTQFGEDANGKSVNPIATKFYDYVVMLLPSREIIALSLKGTGLRVAKELNGLILTRKKGGRSAPVYAGRYTVSTVSRMNAKSAPASFGVYVVKNAGWVPDVDTYDYAKALYESLQGKVLTIEREPGSDDGDDFPTGDASGGATAPEM